MAQVEIDGVPVEYDLFGAGEPVVLVHARPFVDWYLPLVRELGSHAVLHYRRPAPTGRALSIEEDARLCAHLVHHLGLAQAHLVGHSYGGLVAIEVARQGAVVPRSLAVLEPASSGLVAPAEAAAGMAPLLELARRLGPEGAMDAFLRTVCGDEGPELLEALVPGAVADARAAAAGFFGAELPAVIDWVFGPADAAAVGCPVLSVLGSESAPRFVSGAAVLRSLFPGAGEAVVAGANHLLMAQRPAETAEHLERFWRSA